jgi:hypothetical protein
MKRPESLAVRKGKVSTAAFAEYEKVSPESKPDGRIGAWHGSENSTDR